MGGPRAIRQQPEDVTDIVLDNWNPDQLDLADLGVVAAAIVIALVVGWLIRRFAHRAAARAEGVRRTAIELTGQLSSYAVIVLGVVVALEALGLSFGPVLVILAGVVLIVTLAVRPLVQNLGGGLMLQVRSSFRIGDLVETCGVTGTVEDINARAVVIVQSDGRRAHIPNTEVIASIITNLSALGGRRSSLTVGVGNATDIDRVTASLRQALDRVDVLRPDPAPEVTVAELGDNGVELELRFWHGPWLSDETTARDAAARAAKSVLDRLDVRRPYGELDVFTAPQNRSDPAVPADHPVR